MDVGNSYSCSPNALLIDPTITPQAKTVFALLVMESGGTGEVCISQERLAGYMGLKTRKSIYTYLTELEQRGHIVKKQTGFKKANVYTITGIEGICIVKSDGYCGTHHTVSDGYYITHHKPSDEYYNTHHEQKTDSDGYSDTLTKNTNNTDNKEKEIKDNKSKDRIEQTDATHQSSPQQTEDELVAKIRKESSHQKQSSMMIASAKKGQISWEHLTARDYAIHYANYQKKKATNPKGKSGYNFKFDPTNMKTFLDAYNLPAEHTLAILEGIVDDWLASPKGSSLGYISTYMLSRCDSDITDMVERVKASIVPVERKYVSNDFDRTKTEKPKLIEGLVF